jgi:hypothetical protein
MNLINLIPVIPVLFLVIILISARKISDHRDENNKFEYGDSNKMIPNTVYYLMIIVVIGIGLDLMGRYITALLGLMHPLLEIFLKIGFVLIISLMVNLGLNQGIILTRQYITKIGKTEIRIDSIDISKIIRNKYFKVLRINSLLIIWSVFIILGSYSMIISHNNINTLMENPGDMTLAGEFNLNQAQQLSEVDGVTSVLPISESSQSYIFPYKALFTDFDEIRTEYNNILQVSDFNQSDLDNNFLLISENYAEVLNMEDGDSFPVQYNLINDTSKIVIMPVHIIKDFPFVKALDSEYFTIANFGSPFSLLARVDKIVIKIDHIRDYDDIINNIGLILDTEFTITNKSENPFNPLAISYLIFVVIFEFTYFLILQNNYLKSVETSRLKLISRGFEPKRWNMAISTLQANELLLPFLIVMITNYILMNYLSSLLFPIPMYYHSNPNPLLYFMILPVLLSIVLIMIWMKKD